MRLTDWLKEKLNWHFVNSFFFGFNWESINKPKKRSQLRTGNGTHTFLRIFEAKLKTVYLRISWLNFVVRFKENLHSLFQCVFLIISRKTLKNLIFEFQKSKTIFFRQNQNSFRSLESKYKVRPRTSNVTFA